MSAILGAWNRRGEALQPEVPWLMLSALSCAKIDGDNTSSIGPAVFFASRNQKPLLDATGRMLAFEGRLDNREELIVPLGSASDPELALRSYEKWGQSAFARLKGDFALAIFDSRNRKLLLVRDAIGMRPLYWYTRGDLVLFASEIKAILAHPSVETEPLDEGLGTYICAADKNPYQKIGMTCFKGIYVIPPAHVLSIEPDRAKCTRYWDFDTSSPLKLRGMNDYAEAFGDLFRKAVQRRLRSNFPVSVSLSGGLDSSSVFCQSETLLRSGLAIAPGVHAISYVAEGADCDEQEYLGIIEREYAVSVERIDIESKLGFADSAERQLEAIEYPFLDGLWDVVCSVYAAASRNGSRTLMSGHWGDQVLFCTGYIAELAKRGSWITLVRHLFEYPRWFGPGEGAVIQRWAVHAMIREAIPDCLIPGLKAARRMLRPLLSPPRGTEALYEPEWIKKISDCQRADPDAWELPPFHSLQARQLYAEMRSKFHATCNEWASKAASAHGLQAALPFMDQDLLQFLLGLPGEYQNHRGIPRAILRESLRGVLPASIAERKWKADFSRMINRGMEQDYDRLIQLLSGTPEIVCRGYVNEKRLRDSLQGLKTVLKRKDCAHAWDLIDLYGLELWLKRFFLRQTSPNQLKLNTEVRNERERAVIAPSGS